MYPLHRASDNFRKALRIANEITVEKQARYVGSEHFIYAFLSLPECCAYEVLTQGGVSKLQYEPLFFKAIDKDSKHDGLTRRTQQMYDTAVLLAEDNDLPAGTVHMLSMSHPFVRCWLVLALGGMGGKGESGVGANRECKASERRF